MNFINLLPWREMNYHKKQQKLISMLIFSVLFPLLIGIFWHFSYRWLIELKLQEHHQFNKNKGALLEPVNQVVNLIQSNKIWEDKIAWFNRLSLERIVIVNVFDRIHRATPDHLFFTHISREAENIILAGQASNSSQVATLLKNIEQSGILKEVKLNAIKSSEQKEASDDLAHSFSLQAIYPSQN